MNKAPTFKDIIQLWVSEIKNPCPGHFGTIEGHKEFEVRCACHNDITYFWIDGDRVLARPLTFWVSNLNVEQLTHAADPECFNKMYARLDHLHLFLLNFKLDMERCHGGST